MKRYDFDTRPIRPCKPIESPTGAWVPWSEVKLIQERIGGLTDTTERSRTTHDIILSQNAEIMRLKLKVDWLQKCNEGAEAGVIRQQGDLERLKGHLEIAGKNAKVWKEQYYNAGKQRDIQIKNVKLLKEEVDKEVKAHKVTKKALRETQRDLKAVKDEGQRLIKFFDQQQDMLKALIERPQTAT